MATSKIPTPNLPSTRTKEIKKNTTPIVKKNTPNKRPIITNNKKKITLPTPPSRATLLQKNRKTQPSQGM